MLWHFLHPYWFSGDYEAFRFSVVLSFNYMSLRNLTDRAKITFIILSVKRDGGLGFGWMKELHTVWPLEPLHPDLSRSRQWNICARLYFIALIRMHVEKSAQYFFFHDLFIIQRVQLLLLNPYRCLTPLVGIKYLAK